MTVNDLLITNYLSAAQRSFDNIQLLEGGCNHHWHSPYNPRPTDDWENKVEIALCCRIIDVLPPDISRPTIPLIDETLD